jgi:uncharacterized protein YndB with AHSA1/START domain
MASRVGWFAAGAVAAAGVRRLGTRTGVTDEEAFASFPSDDVIPQPMIQWTRGVTVDAPAAAIWPWLVQAGHGRAGWYTPRWVDDIMEPTLFRTRITDRPADDRLHPELQELESGDIVADGPDHAAFFRVLEIQPEQAIAYYSVRHPWRGHPVDPHDPEALRSLEAQLLANGVYLEFTWTFLLRPVTADRTRLLVRTRSMYGPKALAALTPLAALFDATYGVAMLRAIALRAEATTEADLLRLQTARS